VWTTCPQLLRSDRLQRDSNQCPSEHESNALTTRPPPEPNNNRCHLPAVSVTMCHSLPQLCVSHLAVEPLTACNDDIFVENHDFYLPYLHSTTPSGGSPSEYCHNIWYGKTTGWGKIKYPNTKIAISQKCLNIFAPNFAHVFGTMLCTNMLLCAVFTWHVSNWQKRKL